MYRTPITQGIPSVPAVRIFEPQHGELCDFTQAAFPSTLSTWNNSCLQLGGAATHYGFVASGSCEVEFAGSRYHLIEGMYFCVPGVASIDGVGTGFVATRLGFDGLFQLGGPIERTGRLRYIDGCSDTLLIGPPVLGDPCLNLLHIPPNTNQTSHTHPSERLGMIAAGRGICRTSDGELLLEPGILFAIAADAIHSFNTTDESLLVIAWHPDSDCGPSHGNHPMINRTIIDGVSAAKLQAAVKIDTGG